VQNLRLELGVDSRLPIGALYIWEDLHHKVFFLGWGVGEINCITLFAYSFYDFKILKGFDVRESYGIRTD